MPTCNTAQSIHQICNQENRVTNWDRSEVLNAVEFPKIRLAAPFNRLKTRYNGSLYNKISDKTNGLSCTKKPW